MDLVEVTVHSEWPEQLHLSLNDKWHLGIPVTSYIYNAHFILI